MIQPYLSTFTSIISSTSVTDEEGLSLDDHAALDKIVDAFNKIRNTGNTIYLIGNGGSSGIISHVAIDLLNKGHLKAYPVTDNSMITCLANDYGYENVFLKVLEKTGKNGDALIAVSSSGKSPNILNAVRWAKRNGQFVVTLSGFDSQNPLRSEGHINFWLDSADYGKVETGHALLLHMITDALWVKT